MQSTYRSSNGYTNHLHCRHPAYEDLARSALREGNALRLRVVDLRTVDIYHWVVWTIVDKLRPDVRLNTKLSKINRNTIEIYVVAIADCVEARIKRDMPDRFGLVLDGWTHDGRHYMAIFTVVMLAPVGRLVTMFFYDIPYSTRQFILLAFRPLEDETDLGAQSVFDLVADTFSLGMTSPGKLSHLWSETIAP
ncbi:hypothetical protein PI124_g19267 [Phytophthora idaei]|nr:hypothetical protein PI124_g19267 [Phytophthora idaei]